MIKLTFCLVRLPHLTREAFQDYWLNTHSPLVRSLAEALRIRRYVQLHSADPAISADIRASRGAPDQFDGGRAVVQGDVVGDGVEVGERRLRPDYFNHLASRSLA